MKAIAASVLMVVLIGVLFVVGAVSGQVGLSLMAFCSWSPAVLALGFVLGRSRFRLQVVTGDDSEPVEAPRPVRRRERVNMPVVSDVG